MAANPSRYDEYKLRKKTAEARRKAETASRRAEMARLEDRIREQEIKILEGKIVGFINLKLIVSTGCSMLVGT
jgi:hypothetical protein